MSVLAMKFGGTSVGSTNAINQLSQIVAQQQSQWKNIVVVVSAMSGVTDMLIQSAHTAAAGDLVKAKESAAALRSRHLMTLSELAGSDSAHAETLAAVNTLLDEFELLAQPRIFGVFDFSALFDGLRPYLAEGEQALFVVFCLSGSGLNFGFQLDQG